jgi:hypothetical protein
MNITAEQATELFFTLLKSYNINEIASGVGVNVGTAKRWRDTKSVPRQYYIELCRYANIDIDYGELSYIDKDQFYTHSDTALECVNIFKEVVSKYDDVSEYKFIEPSVGSGSFSKHLPEDSILIDVEPRVPNAIRADFLTYTPPKGKYVVIGNPPFGFRGNLALKFINHSYNFADYVAFIVPQTFESDGKGSCKSRVVGYNLIHSQTIDSQFFYPDQKLTTVSCVFQVWSKNHSVPSDLCDISHLCDIISVSDGGTPSTTRNKKYHDVCDYFVVSSHYGVDKLKLVRKFSDLDRGGYGFLIHDDRIREYIERLDFASICFTSTNGAVNLRTDLITKELCRIIPDELKGSGPGVLPI